MGDVIDLKRRREAHAAYQEQLTLAGDSLRAMAEELFSLAINLACSGQWKEWSDAQPAGAVMSFDEMSLSSRRAE